LNVYMLRADSDHFKCLIMPNDDLFDFARRFNGKPMNCKTFYEIICVDPDSYSSPKGDFPSLIPGVPVFSRRAVVELRDLLDGNGELLSTFIGPEEYFLFNVTRVIDALDVSRSDVIRFENSSKVLDIDSHVFYRGRIGGIPIFKIPQVLTMDVFVTDRFVDRVHTAGLKGFWFPLVWSS
jgi:hypothetical protein